MWSVIRVKETSRVSIPSRESLPLSWKSFGFSARNIRAICFRVNSMSISFFVYISAVIGQDNSLGLKSFFRSLE